MAIGVEIRCGPLAGHPAPGEEVGFADDLRRLRFFGQWDKLKADRSKEA